MNIVITTPQFPTADSPFAHIYVAEQARALSRCGHRVAILCAQQHPDGQRGYRLQESLWEGLPVIRITYPCVRKTWYLPCVIGLLRGLRHMRRYFRPDIIHAHVTLPIGLGALLAGRVCGLPLLITEHWGPIRDLRRRRVDAWGMDFALRHADVVIAVSEHLKRELCSELELTRPIHVIPNLTDPTKFYSVPPPGNNAPALDVLFVGRAGDARKGNDLMVRAFAQARRQSKQLARLVLVGAGLDEELRPLANALDIAPHCVFTGALPLDQLAALMQQCGCLVVASRYETFSLVLVEAMACGKPVIATRCGGPEELVTPETGLLVPAEDVDALAGAMVEMSRNVHRYNAKFIARYAYERYSEDVVVPQLNEVYEHLLGSALTQEP